MVSLEYIMITSAIDTHEIRDLDTIYIPVTYIQTESDEDFIMILKGILTELLVNIDLGLYWKYVVIEKGVYIFCAK